MNDNLFDIPETKSPRLIWMERHKIECHKIEYDHAGLTDPNDLWMAKSMDSHCEGRGPTVGDAIVSLAKKMNIKLWNES